MKLSEAIGHATKADIVKALDELCPKSWDMDRKLTVELAHATWKRTQSDEDAAAAKSSAHKFGTVSHVRAWNAYMRAAKVQEAAWDRLEALRNEKGGAK